MNRDGFTLLAMGFTGTDALRWKLKYIEAFNAMEARLKAQSAAPAVLTKREALLIALEAEERAEKAEAMVAVVAGALDRIKGNGKPIALSLAAKACKISHDLFFAWLSSKGIIFKRSGTWIANAAYEKSGHLVMVSSEACNGHAFVQCKVTEYGVKEFAKMAERDGMLNVANESAIIAALRRKPENQLMLN